VRGVCWCLPSVFTLGVVGLKNCSTSNSNLQLLLACMHPALKELLEKGLVKMEKKGRAKVYTLSGQGREELDKACKYFCSAYGDIFDEYGKKK